MVTDPTEVAEALAEQAARTTSRSELARRHPDLDSVSPHVGELDIEALGQRLDEDIDLALPLLVDLARATDGGLRARVREVAARLLLPPSYDRLDGHRSGAARLITDGGPGVDFDADATIERLAGAPEPWNADELRWRSWRRPSRAYVLVLDASGSVTGTPLATALISTAALAGRLRPGDELGVVVFWSRALVLRHVASAEQPALVLDRLLDLRGGDTTDLALGLRTGLAQATASRAPRTDVLVLTDGQANEGDDPRRIAATAATSGARIHALAVSDHPDAVDACTRLADLGGGRTAVMSAPSQAAGALAHVLSHT